MHLKISTFKVSHLVHVQCDCIFQVSAVSFKKHNMYEFCE